MSETKSKKDIFSEPDKGMQEARGTLSRLFRKILYDRSLTPYSRNQLMAKWLDDPANGVPANAKDRSSARGNLTRELHKDSMTFKVFYKALRFLRPLGIKFTTTLEWEDNEVTSHCVDMVTNEMRARRQAMSMNMNETTTDVSSPPSKSTLPDDVTKLDRSQDGISYINIWSKAETQLGRWLSNFSRSPFNHPKHGMFVSVEGYWYWLKTGMKHDELKRLYGFAAKKRGRQLDKVDHPEGEEGFRHDVEQAIIAKLEANAPMRSMFLSTTLPFVHVYFYADQVLKPPSGTWLEDFLNALRDRWQRSGQTNA